MILSIQNLWSFEFSLTACLVCTRVWPCMCVCARVHCLQSYGCCLSITHNQQPLNSALRHLHLGASGLSFASVASLAAFLTRHLGQLESLYLDINRLKDEGVAVVCEVLSRSTCLKRLSVGSNGLSDKGLRSVVECVLQVHTLEMLDVGFYKSTQDLGEA